MGAVHIRSPPNLFLTCICKKGEKSMGYEKMYKYKKWLNGTSNYNKNELIEKGLNEKLIKELNNMD